MRSIAACALPCPPRAAVSVFPKGTPLPCVAAAVDAGSDVAASSIEDANAQLSVLSYNTLAPLYVRPIDKRTGKVQDFAAFEWAEPAAEVLAWESRAPRLLAEIEQSKADVIALQELQFERAAPTDMAADPDTEAADTNGASADTAGADSAATVRMGRAGAGIKRDRVEEKPSFELPSWLHPLLTDADGRRGYCYAAEMPPQTELAHIAARNARVLGREVQGIARDLFCQARLYQARARPALVPKGAR